MTKVYTTLNAVKKHGLCGNQMQELLKHLGKTKADDEPLAMVDILKSNGISDAIWCLRALTDEHHKNITLFAADCAESVLHLYEKKYPNDKRPRAAIEAARAGDAHAADAAFAADAAAAAANADARAVFYAAAAATFAADAAAAARAVFYAAAAAAANADADADADARAAAAFAAAAAARAVFYAAADRAVFYAAAATAAFSAAAERKKQEEFFIKHFG